jgi:hypothetical protein
MAADKAADKGAGYNQVAPLRGLMASPFPYCCEQGTKQAGSEEAGHHPDQLGARAIVQRGQEHFI